MNFDGILYIVEESRFDDHIQRVPSENYCHDKLLPIIWNYNIKNYATIVN